MKNKSNQVKFMDTLALLVVAAIMLQSFIKNIDMGETYKTILVAIIMYYFGSSRGSQKKDETIASMQEQPTVKADTLNAENVETVNTNTTNVK